MYHKAILMLLTTVFALSGCEDGYIFPNEAPSGLAISKDVCYVTVGEEVSLSGSAVDGDGDPIYYQWTATAGTFEPPDGKGDAVIWAAPQIPGTITITLSVTDEIETSRTSEIIEVGGSFPGFITTSKTIADSGFVYILDKLQPVVVPDDITLTLTGGVRIVVSNENSGIDVEGRLVVLGTQGSEVVIGPSSCLPSDGEWNGIRFDGVAAQGELAFMRVHSADNGIVISGGASVNMRNCTMNNHSNNGVEVSDGASLTMTECTIWENDTGIYARNGFLDIQRSSIRYNGEIGVELNSTSEEFTAEIDTCNISNNDRYGILIAGILKPEIHYCSIFSNGFTGTGEAVRLEAYTETDSVRVDFNFWGIGKDSEEEIALLVHDMNDVSGGIEAYIDFMPWLTSEPGGAP